MTFTNQLQEFEHELKRLLVLDDAELQATVEQMNRPEWAAEASSQGYVAGTLFSIEHTCRMLRERLHVQMSVATQVEMSVVLTDVAGRVVSRGQTIQTSSHLVEEQSELGQSLRFRRREREAQGGNDAQSPQHDLPPDPEPPSQS